jgi:hypothetical protein
MKRNDLFEGKNSHICKVCLKNKAIKGENVPNFEDNFLDNSDPNIEQDIPIW